jgi:hypothetical protein
MHREILVNPSDVYMENQRHDLYVFGDIVFEDRTFAWQSSRQSPISVA